MKRNRTKQSLVFMFFVLLFALAALFQLQARIRTEASDKAVAVVMLQEDVQRLSESSGESLDNWYQALVESGLAAVIVPEDQLNDTALTSPITQAGLEIAQMGGSGNTGLYFAPVEYDIAVSLGESSAAEIAPADSGRVWVLVENNPQTGCVLPEHYSPTDADALWAKGFYLRQNTRARAVTTEMDDSTEVGDMLFRAVADRGVQVLWIAPLGDESGLNSNLQTYTDLLGRLQNRIERCGFHFGIPQGMEALNVSAPVLILCGLGIFAATMLLLCLLFPIGKGLAIILYAVCAFQCIIFGIWKSSLQEMLLALGASIVFPALSVYDLANHLSEAKRTQQTSLLNYLKTVLIGAFITMLGGAYIGAVFGSWRYILVLQVFRGVKLSQFAVYLFSIVLMGMMMLELQKGKSLKALIPAVDKRLVVRVVSVLIILFGVGMIYLMRSGDGMLGVSSLESKLRAALENLILYRPRTKEFLIAWPAIAIAFCFAVREDRLFAWLFGAMGGIGFASIANTFCHIRAHFLVSIARTAFGLIIGLLIGSLLFILFRPSKE